MSEEADLAACRQKIRDLEAENARLKHILAERQRGDFDEAFATARSMGLRTFFWRGAEYHTRTREEEEAGTAQAGLPAPQQIGPQNLGINLGAPGRTS